MNWSTTSDLPVGDVIGRREVLKAKIDSETSEVLCPTCDKSNFRIFRRDRASQVIYLNHCKCENCGQLFLFNVNKKNNPFIEEDKNGI